MASALGLRASSAPLPTGVVSRIDGYGGGGAPAWPPVGYYICADAAQTIGMAVGPFTRPERVWLCARCWCITAGSAGAWSNQVGILRLVNGSMQPVNDVLGFGHAYGYNTNESDGHADGWKQMCWEAHFILEANLTYNVQMISGGGSGSYFAGAQDHLGLHAYTIGEGAV
jgi:hypothetical protein